MKRNFYQSLSNFFLKLCISTKHCLGVAIQSSRDVEVLRKAIAKGLFMNVAQLTLEGHYVALDSGQHVHIHPSSVMFK